MTVCLHLVVQIFDAKSLTEVSKDLWAVFLELEVTGQIFPAKRIKKDMLFIKSIHNSSGLHVGFRKKSRNVFILLVHI